MCQSFSQFLGFLHHSVFVKLVTSSIRVNRCMIIIPPSDVLRVHALYHQSLFQDAMVSVGFCSSLRKLSRSGWGNVVAVKAENLIPDVSVEDDGTNHTKNLKKRK